MGLGRLRGINPGRLAVFAGALAQQPAAVQREVAAEIERLGYGALWYGEAMGREAFAQGAIFLAATTRLVVASGIANIWARDAMAMVAGGRPWPKRGRVASSSASASATRRWSLAGATATSGRWPACVSTSTPWST
jgi:hypothetical protein